MAMYQRGGGGGRFCNVGGIGGEEQNGDEKGGGEQDVSIE